MSDVWVDEVVTVSVLDLAIEVYTMLFDATESFHYSVHKEEFGACVAYLLGGIVRSADNPDYIMQINCGATLAEQPEVPSWDRHFLSIMKRVFTPDHLVWQYIDVRDDVLASIEAAKE